MKRKIINLFKVLAITAMAFTSNSCSDLFNDPLKDKETGEDINLLLVDLNFFDTKVTLKFEDIETGELLTGTEITAGLKGDMADSFVNIFGEKSVAFTTSSGIMEFYLDPSVTPENSPMELEAIALAQPLWISAPTSFEITSSGERIIVVRMIDWANSTNVKSAKLNNANNVDINVTISPWEDTREYDISKYQNKDGEYNLVKEYFTDAESQPSIDPMMCLVFFQCESTPSNPITFNCKTNSISGIDEKLVSFWGFKETNSKNTTVNSGTTLTTAYKLNDLSKCDNGLTIKISCPDLDAGDNTSSADFKYKIEFSDGTSQSGEIGGTFSDLSTKGAKIEPIYYPANSKITLTLEGNPQYTFDTPSQTNLDPCGVATFVAKKKTGFTTFKFSTSYRCLSSSVALKYTGKGYIKNKTKNTGEEFFDLVAGQFTLNLIKGDQYQLTVIIDSKAYSMNLDTNNILGSTVSDSNISSFSISQDTEGENSYIVEFKLNNDDLCSKL